MNITGIIAEYNPFHKGHAYHISQTRQITHADFILVVMGGNFIQRGEPAIVDKYERTKMALLGGADLVVELPATFATGSAEYFAEGAVELLEGAGVVNALCFGSEEGELSMLKKAAQVLLSEPEVYRTVLQERLKVGKSFPAAREEALGKVLALSKEQCSTLFSSPNNILGIEYLKALEKRHSTIEAYTIPRKGSYHETASSVKQEYASASTIRRELFSLKEWMEQGMPAGDNYAAKSLFPALKEQLPNFSYRLLLDNFPYSSFTQLENFSLPLHYRLLQAKDPLEFSAFQDVSEDLSRRIFSLRNEFFGYESFLDLVKTRQYTRTRIARALLHILLGIRKEDIVLPNYLRILGFRKDAVPLLSELKKKSRLPLITKVAGHAELSRELAFSTFYHLGEAYSEAQRQLIIL